MDPLVYLLFPLSLPLFCPNKTKNHLLLLGHMERYTLGGKVKTGTSHAEDFELVQWEFCAIGPIAEPTLERPEHVPSMCTHAPQPLQSGLKCLQV